MLLFTDFHVGKSRDLFYTTITTEFIDWFCNLAQSTPGIDCIGFLGDWHENRNHLHIDTLNLSYQLTEKLNNLDLPVYFIIGNHDLFNKHNRELHSCVFFNRLSNFIVIDQPVIRPEFDGSALFSPFLFHNEYETTLHDQTSQHLLGHFEFKDFIVTGYNTKMEFGPDCTEFADYKKILSGHFHKRQKTRNVEYIGNTFSTSFADANDIQRGACIYEFDKAKTTYVNWTGGPQYIKTTLSALSDGKVNATLTDRTFVRCIADTSITYEEHSAIKEMFTKQYGVRSITIEEDKVATKQILAETLPGITSDELAKSTTDELIHKMLQQLTAEGIDNKTLVDLYKTLGKPQ